jgi:hypothetical protein
MARAGRKRKIGLREPSGRVQRVPQRRQEEMERATAANQPHRAVLPKHLREDPRAGTAAGRLFLLGKIDADQLVAAERFVSLVRQFLHILSAPMAPASFLGKIVAPSPASPLDVEERLGDEEPEEEEDRHERIGRQFQSVCRALTEASRQEVLVDRVVEETGEISAAMMARQVNLLAVAKAVLIDGKPCEDIGSLRRALDVVDRTIGAKRRGLRAVTSS